MHTVEVAVRPLQLRLLPTPVAITRATPGVGGEVRMTMDAPDGRTAVGPAGPGDPAWAALHVTSSHDLAEPGMLVGVLAPLAAARIPVFACSTVDADVVLVPWDRRDDAVAALRAVGHGLA